MIEENENYKIIKSIIVFSFSEWSFYLFLFFPALQRLIMKNAEINNKPDIFLINLVIIFMSVSIIYFFYKFKKKMINPDFKLKNYLVQIIKHMFKIIIIFIITLIIIFIFTIFLKIDPDKSGIIFSIEIPVLAFIITYFISNYGFSLIILKNTSKKSIKGSFKVLFSKYNLLNLITVVILIAINKLFKLLPDEGLFVDIIRYILSVVEFAYLPLCILFLCKYAESFKIFEVK